MAAPRRMGRPTYRGTMRSSVMHQEAYDCIVSMITTPAPKGKGSFTQKEIEQLTVARLNKRFPGTPYRAANLRWDWMVRFVRDKLGLDLIPLCDYYFSKVWKEGKSREYDEFHGVSANVVAKRSISCIPPTPGTVGYVASSSRVHQVDSILVMTWLEWRKSVGKGHIINEIACQTRAVANLAITQAEADMIIPRTSIPPIRRLLR